MYSSLYYTSELSILKYLQLCDMTHTYAEAGTYIITATLTNALSSSEKNVTVVIDEAIENANASVTTVLQGEENTITFGATSGTG